MGLPVSSDSIHNRNCYLYLKQLWEALQNPNFPRSTPPFKDIHQLFEKSKDKLSLEREDKSYPYGDLYTQIFKLLDQEATVNRIREALKILQHDEAQAVHHFIDRFYANDNGILSETYEKIEPLLRRQTPSSSSLERLIHSELSSSSDSINTITPTDMNSNWTRFHATFLSSHFKPQHTTSLATVRHYEFHDTGSHPKEYRFGTQWQRENGASKTSPLFRLWLETQKALAGPETPKPHIYFNFLMHRSTGVIDFEGAREASGSGALHKLEESHDNLIVVTLPADKGWMSKHAYKDTRQNLNFSEVFNACLEVALGQGDVQHQNFALSSKLRRQLFGEDLASQEATFRALLEKSARAIGIDPGIVRLNPGFTVSPAERQAMWFHFVNYEIPHLLIEKLKPASVNFSCKDAIDRGGVASAYYNLITSFGTSSPMSRSEFDQAVQAAATMVKGRGMNHHIHRLWNCVNAYVQTNLGTLANDPDKAWLIQWRDMHCPHELVNDVLNNSVNSYIVLLTEKQNPDDQQKPEYQQRNSCITCLQQIQQHMRHQVSGKRLLLEAAARTMELGLCLPKNLKQKLSDYAALCKKFDATHGYGASTLRVIGGALKICLGNLLKLSLVGMKAGDKIARAGHATLMAGWHRKERAELSKTLKGMGSNPSSPAQ